jgi:hypothetical protein
MLALVERLFSFTRQTESLEVESESASTLTLRQGRVLTRFDRLSRAVTQRGRVVATFGSTQSVRVREHPTADGPIVWSVTLQLAGTRMVEVGRAADQAAASLVAVRIATITGTRVIS